MVQTPEELWIAMKEALVLHCKIEGAVFVKFW